MAVHPYHGRTEHTWESVRQQGGLDWAAQPRTEKIYPASVPSLDLASVPELAGFLRLCCGPSDRSLYPSGLLIRRVNPSAGALYPCELYVQSRGEPDLEDGIYHLEPLRDRLRLLARISDDQGLEGYWPGPGGVEGVILLVTAVYGRSSWKYGTRALRYCLLDGGHLLGAVEAAAEAWGRNLWIRSRFDRLRLARDFCFHGQELPLAMAVLGRESQKRVQPPSLQLDFVEEARAMVRDPDIEKAFAGMAAVGECSEENGAEGAGDFRYGVAAQRLKQAIMDRRSIRVFTGSPLPEAVLDRILAALRAPVPMDCLEGLSVHAVINRVAGREPGLVRDGELIRPGDLSALAGYLCLEQRLGSDSGATLFLVSGGGNYLPLMLKAGLLGQRAYLIATLAGIGCSGIGALYDRETMAFLGSSDMVLYALAVGL